MVTILSDESKTHRMTLISRIKEWGISTVLHSLSGGYNDVGKNDSFQRVTSVTILFLEVV